MDAIIIPWIKAIFLILALIGTWLYGEYKEAKARKQTKTIWWAKPMEKRDLIPGEHYKVIGIGASDEGREEPRFAFALLKGKKNPKNTYAEEFCVDFTIIDVADEKRNFRVKAGNTISITAKGEIVVVHQ